jgi:hypothetical protein
VVFNSRRFGTVCSIFIGEWCLVADVSEHCLFHLYRCVDIVWCLIADVSEHCLFLLYRRVDIVWCLIADVSEHCVEFYIRFGVTAYYVIRFQM